MSRELNLTKRLQNVNRTFDVCKRNLFEIFLLRKLTVTEIDVGSIQLPLLGPATFACITWIFIEKNSQRL